MVNLPGSGEKKCKERYNKEKITDPRLIGKTDRQKLATQCVNFSESGIAKVE